MFGLHRFVVLVFCMHCIKYLDKTNHQNQQHYPFKRHEHHHGRPLIKIFLFVQYNTFYYACAKSVVAENMSADGKHPRGRTRILSDSARKRNRKKVLANKTRIIIGHQHDSWMKTCIFIAFFVCSLSHSIINYACSNFRTTCAMALMFTLQHEFELSTLPSIASNRGFLSRYSFTRRTLKTRTY
jgi:hypothetical protein